MTILSLAVIGFCLQIFGHIAWVSLPSYRIRILKNYRVYFSVCEKLGGHKGGIGNAVGALPHFICQDVREANRLLTRLEELSACLETNKTPASLELAEQVTGLVANSLA